MSFYCGTSAYGTTGLKSTVLPLNPVGAKFSVCQKVGTTQNFEHRSIGVTDGTRQHVHSTFQDITGGKSENTSGRVVKHYERVGGALQVVLEVQFVSFGLGQIDIDVVTPNPNYSILIEAWD